MAAGVLVVGAGVAALEAVTALRALAGSRVEITLVAPATRFAPGAMSITGEPGGPAFEKSLRGPMPW